MSAHLLVFVCCLVGFVALALAMERHARQVLAGGLTASTRRMLRIGGWAMLGVGLLAAVNVWRYDLGLTTWVGWLGFAALIVVFTLPRFTREEPKSQKTRTRRRSANAIDVQTTALPQQRHTLALTAMLTLPLVFFLWLILRAPPEPLQREDALAATIGPWDFVIAERERKAPTIEALDTPLKEFVIRFCDSCDAEIAMAYLKLRKPRSLRAAGNHVAGRRERSATITIPPAVTVEEGLWLTVEGRQGDVHHLQLDLQRLSPSTARFIKERS